MKKRLVRLLAWAVTAGLLVLLFRRIPLHEVLDAARGAAPWTVPAAFCFALLIYLGDSFAIWKTFGWFLAPLSFADVLLVRGATYLLAAINYNVGQGAIVYFVHRVARVPVMRGVATVLLIMGVNVLALLFLATFGLVAAPAVPHVLRLIVAVAYAGLAVYAVAVILKPRWLATRPLFDVLLGAGLGGHARALLVRLPHIASLFAMQIVMMRAFGIVVPVFDAIAALPVVFFVAVLPISVQGLGTTQATMIYFFARYAPGDSHAQQAAVLAASLVTPVCISIFQAALGVACLRSRVGRALTAASAEAQAASTVAAPS
ncbi:MAG TPA: hypothetical protein VI456_17130 [Polyangia bacterium]